MKRAMLLIAMLIFGTEAYCSAGGAAVASDPSNFMVINFDEKYPKLNEMNMSLRQIIAGDWTDSWIVTELTVGAMPLMEIKDLAISKQEYFKQNTRVCYYSISRNEAVFDARCAVSLMRLNGVQTILPKSEELQRAVSSMRLNGAQTRLPNNEEFQQAVREACYLEWMREHVEY